MKLLFDKVIELVNHLNGLDETFYNEVNYTDRNDYELYIKNRKRLDELIEKKKDGERLYSFTDEIYSVDKRQMKIADIIEYILFHRGVYYLFQQNKIKEDRVKDFLEINLRIVNLLMLYETITVDVTLRNAYLDKLKTIIGKEEGYKDLRESDEIVGLPENKENKKNKAVSINEYFDTLLPKTAGGLWHEILVYCYILRYDIGYIFPLLLTQKIISRDEKLSPPDLIILQKYTKRYYGIEIGQLKERQSNSFVGDTAIPIISVDTRNARISDRCPICNKWIGICDKVIDDFSKKGFEEIIPPEIKCLKECEKYSLQEKLDGNCKYMKFSSSAAKFEPCNSGQHYHYHCVRNEDKIYKNIKDEVDRCHNLNDLNDLLKDYTTNQEKISLLQSDLKKQFTYIKTHSIEYKELDKLMIDGSKIGTEIKTLSKWHSIKSFINEIFK